MNSISDIIYEDVNKDYGYGNYLGLKLLIHKQSGMINATKLCKENGKQFKNWLQNKQITELMQKILLAGIPASKMIDEHKNVGKYLRGTYIHRRLILSLSMWISDEIHYKVESIIEDYVYKQYIDTIKLKDDTIKLKDDTIKLKDDKIDELINIVKQQSLKSDQQSEQIRLLFQQNNEVLQITTDIKDYNFELLDKNTNLEQKVDTLTGSIDTLTGQVDTLTDSVETIKVKLDIATDDMIIKPRNTKKIPQFALLKKIDSDNTFRSLHRNNQDINRQINTLTKCKNPKYEVVLQLYTPNGIVLYQRMKEDLKDCMYTHYNDITFIKNKNIKNNNEFIEAVRDLSQKNKDFMI